jgi:hypothetical protein
MPVYKNSIVVDAIIPLGEECCTSQMLDPKFNTAGVRKEAFPFDYVGHTYVERILETLNTDLTELPLDVHIAKCGDDYFYQDKQFGFYYWHDTTHKLPTDFTEGEYIAFVDKYRRRYTRMNQYIDSRKPILCICVQHYDKTYTSEIRHTSIELLYDQLKRRNPNLHMIAFNFGSEKSHDMLEYINLPVDHTLPFDTSKQAYQKELLAWYNANIHP